MALTEEILVKLTAQDNVSGTLKGINGFLKTNVGSTLTAFGNKMTSLSKEAIDAAVTAESEWNRFGAAVDAVGGKWDENKESIKSWVKSYSNEMGRAVSDTRAGMTAFMNYGLSVEESKKAMEAASGMAAALGVDEETAANNIVKAFGGAGRSLKQLGLNIADYKDKTTGAIDKTKLLNDIMSKTGGAADKYANSTEAKAQRVKNQLAAMKTDFGQQLLIVLEPLLPVLQQFLQAINQLPGPVKTFGAALMGLTAAAAVVSGPILSMMGIFEQLTGIFGNLSKGKDSGGGGSVLSKVKQKITSTVRDAEKIGTLAPEGAAAAAGEEATAVSLQGIATGAASLLAPLLEIAIVVAVMIPIVAGLAAEALIFIKAIQMLIKWLSFDSINLDGAIKGIQQVAMAMLMVAAAMGSMLVAGITTALANVMTLGTIVPLISAALVQIKAVAQELQKLKSLPTIDASITIKLTLLKSAINSVSSAMSSLANLSWNTMMGNLMTLGGLLGNFQSHLKSAMNDLKSAVKVLQEFNGANYTIPDGIGQKLTNLADALKPVKEGINSMKSINDAQFSWNPLNNLIKALKSAKTDLAKAASVLQDFNATQYNIPEGIGQKLTNLADALKPIKEGINSMKSINDAQTSWNPLNNLVKALKSAKSDLQKAASVLREFNGANYDIPEGIGQKITNLANALKPITIAIDNLNNIKSNYKPQVASGGNNQSAVTIQEALDEVKGDIQKTAQVLNELNTDDLGNIDGVGEKITTLANALKPIMTAIDSLNKLKDSYSKSQGSNGQGSGGGQTGNSGATIQQAIESMKSDISSTVKALGEINSVMGEVGDIGGVGEKINQVGSAMKTVQSAVDTLNRLKEQYSTNGEQGGTNIATAINNAKTDLISAGNAIKGLQQVPQIPEGLATRVTRVADALKPLRNAIQVINQNPIPQTNVSVESIKNAVQKVKQIAQSLNTLNGTTVNSAGALTAVRNAINQIKQVLSTGVGGVSASAVNIGRSIGNGIKTGLSNAKGQVTSIMSSMMSSLRSIASSGGSSAGSAAHSAFNSSFKLADVATAEMNHIKEAISGKKDEIVQAIRNLANDATTTFTLSLDVQSPGLMARTMGAEMGYIQQSIVSRTANITNSVRTLAKSIVEGFGKPKLEIFDNFDEVDYPNMNIANASVLSRQQVPNVGNASNTVVFNFENGAIPIDARNMSTEESKRMMINALESLDQVRNINIRGM